VGDAEFQKKCLGKLDRIANRGDRTVLLVSHNMAAIRRLCRRAILLEQGRVREIGAAGAVIDRYLSRSPQAESGGSAHAGGSQGGIKIMGLAARRENDDLRLQLEFANQTSKPRIGIGLNIRGQDGTLVASLKPFKTRLVVAGGQPRYALSIVLKDVLKLLTAGAYTVDLWFADPGIERLRSIEGAFRFEVPLNDRYCSGHSLTQAEDGYVALEARIEERVGVAA
jgi:lipopolysaccharide transport system ATP-binding protein